jgi:hypothetical protein
MEQKDLMLCVFAIIIIVVIVIIVIVMIAKSSKSTPSDNKEGFMMVNGPASVNEMGVISSGDGIFTDSTLKDDYKDIVKAVKDNHFYSDNSTIGVGEGDGMEAAYESMMQIQALDNGTTGVKDQEEMTKISKQINALNANNNSCIFNRAGTTKARIKLEPMGTAGVCQQYTPERDRNHEIRMVANAIDVMGFDIDTNRIQDQFDSQGKYAAHDGEIDGKSLIGSSTAKMFSPNIAPTITACGYAGKNVPSQVMSAPNSSKSGVTESFSYM